MDPRRVVPAASSDAPGFALANTFNNPVLRFSCGPATLDCRSRALLGILERTRSWAQSSLCRALGQPGSSEPDKAPLAGQPAIRHSAYKILLNRNPRSHHVGPRRVERPQYARGSQDGEGAAVS
jgi:hypothetical protein